MGKIHKSSSSRHEATLSPALSEFIQSTTSISLPELQPHLDSFPRLWPFPRGDLYHWIPVLNRFDDILKLFVETYDLSKGPQVTPFERKLLLRGDGDKCTTVKDATSHTEDTLTSLGFAADGDRMLIESILSFTELLLDNAGNRSLYASSEELGSLLNTTSLSLLKATLRVLLRLAKRLHASKQRFTNNSYRTKDLLSTHYHVDMANLRKLATPFPKVPSAVVSAPSSAKGKDKAIAVKAPSTTDNKIAPADLVSIVKGNGADDTMWQQWGHVSMSTYDAQQSSAIDQRVTDTPASGEEASSSSLPRRLSFAAHQPIRPSRLSSDDDPSSTSPIQSRIEPESLPLDGPASTSETMDIDYEVLSAQPAHKIVQDNMPAVHPQSRYDLLHKVRVAKALSGDQASRESIVAVRMLAIANLAYVDDDPQFQQQVTIPDSQEPRRFQLAHQLAELVHPPETAGFGASKELQTLALWALESLTKQKSRANDVYTALNANVNHGILFYVVRKAVSELATEDRVEPNMAEEEWRDALWSLLASLPGSAPRAGDAMMSAGLLDILTEVLGLRTSKAERNHWKVLQFLDNFVYGVRDAFQTLANAKGLELISALTSFTVSDSYTRAEQGDGMPEKYKTQVTDYQIPFYQQLTLRWLFKFLNHSMNNNGGTLNRQLRNLIESPKLLDALRQVLNRGSVYGSNVWSGALNILSNFLHNEPTGFPVIAEAHLPDIFIESVTRNSNGSEVGILPASEAIQAVPTAFDATCLNENGLKQFQESKALESFFRIFESAEHVKGMDLDTSDVPTMLGNSFDELVRHHPQLKQRVLDNVVEMVKRVRDLCFTRAADQGVGTKLWVTGEDGKLYVAGGRTALLGKDEEPAKESQQTDASGDVDMLREETAKGETANVSQVSIDEVIETEDAKSGPTVTQYIGVVSRFLGGYFNNKSCCQSFLEAGALDDLLDFATLPCLPYNFEGGFGFGDELLTTIRCVIEEKSHYALPAIIKRINAAMGDLTPMLNHDSETPFFAPFTSVAEQSGPAQDTSAGTRYAKALVIIHTLCNALSTTFQTQVFSQRSQSNIFYQVNLADMYITLIQDLGKLHRACVWEEILLQKNMPAKWEPLTRVHSMGFGDEEADHIFRISHHDRIEEPGALTQGRSTTPVGSPARSQSRQSDGSRSVNDPDQSAYFKNTRTLRYLLSQVPVSIVPLFQSIGRILLIRRVMDPYQKFNATKVADELAASILEELRFELPKQTASARDRYSYWIVILTSLNHVIMDEAFERPSPQTLTLVLQALKNQGGFAILETILDAFVDEANAIIAITGNETLQKEEGSLLNLAFGGIKLILQFYSRIINSRHVNDAIQTQAMQSRNTDKDKPDYFSPSQFLVELRFAVIRPVQKIWDSALMDKATTSLVKNLIEILRLELEGDSETGAYARTDKISRRRKLPPKKWTVKSLEAFNRLRDDYGDELAREAMYRCYENTTTARDYCVAQKNHHRATRNPIPADELQTANVSQPGERSDANEAPTASSSTEPAASESATDALLDIADSDDDPMTRLALSPFGRRVLDTDTDGARDSPPVSREDLVEAEKLPDVVTIDDLNEERAKLRLSLIERCLDILNVHDDVTFELADLISAAVGSDQHSIRRQNIDPNSLRQDIGSVLLQSLISLQMDEAPSAEDEFRQQARKVASYAHLLALVLQDKNFYDAIVDQLVDSFGMLVGFIKILHPPSKAVDSTTWIPHVLLILERLLAEDAQPRKIEFSTPGPNDPIEQSPIAQVGPPLISVEDKDLLFEALLKILPKIGKDESLALSVARVLVILTRQRELATKLGERSNLQGLFTMIRQLADLTNDRLQSALMLCLRHIIEDEETIRQIMRSEIQAVFETRQQRQIDTTSYTRTLHHLVVRSPKIFVEVTNEKLMIPRYDSKLPTHVLALKKDEKSSSFDADSKSEANRNDKDPIEQSNVADVVEPPPPPPPPPAPPTDKPVLERTKTSELKMPIIENPDGVIHFLISELLNYKEVEDLQAQRDGSEKTRESTLEDVEMTNGDTASQDTSLKDGEQKSGGKKEAFKPEQHPIYIYRCILLQCLTELLGCYNRTKIEFINYKRKADPQGATPSKPRSFVLNYLLNNLIPRGTIDDHDESVVTKKRVQTSSWAISVIVALCSKTGERGYVKPPRDLKDYEEEPELLFVRKFVLEHALRTYKEAQSSSEPLDYKYSRLLGLADLFNRMLTGKPNSGGTNNGLTLEMLMASQRMLAKIMYEKGFISALTASIADIDLKYPHAKRAVKYILRPLKLLTQTAVDLSQHTDMVVAPGDIDVDEISSASSVSENESNDNDVREETPDLFRNSALGILDPRRSEAGESSPSDDDEDEMYDEDYADEMDYNEEMPEHDSDEVVSDDEDDMEGMGPVEGLPGDVGMDVEVIMEPGDDEPDPYDEDDDEDDDEDVDDDDELDEEEDEDDEDLEAMDDAEEGEGGSVGADDEEWIEEDGEEYLGHDMVEDGGIPSEMDLVRVFEGTDAAQTLIEQLGNGAHFDVVEDTQVYPDDEMVEDEDDEDEDDFEEEELAYEPDLDDEDDLIIRDRDMPSMRWQWDTDLHNSRSIFHQGHHHHHHHHRPHFAVRSHPWGLFGGPPPGADDRMLIPGYRSSRPGGTQRAENDGTNPLLQRQGRDGSRASSRRRGEAMSDWVTALDPMRPGRFITGDGPVSFISNLINMMTHGGPNPITQGGTVSIQLHGLPFGTHQIAHFPATFDAFLRHGTRRFHSDQSTSRPSRDDPVQATNFVPTFTVGRWQEEARLLFGQGGSSEKTQPVIDAILRLLVPPAREAQKRREEEAERREQERKEQEAAQKVKEEAEKKEREEREAKEKKEREEREAAAEAEAAAARAREQAETEDINAEQESVSQDMEGVEQAEPGESRVEEAPAGPSEPAGRIVTNIRGREVDITGLGIDLEYLEALPEELREDVILTQVAQHRSQAAATGEQPTSIPPDFLEQLPPEIREEILAQEAAERRRREREEARRRAAVSGGPARAEEMDPASFFATLDPQLRTTLLMETDDDTLALLPPEVAAEARALSGDRRLHLGDLSGLGRNRLREVEREDRHEEQASRKPRPVVQILDKAGVATLLRLMFIPQQGGAKSSLNGILKDVCCNKQNRAEVVSILLSILQDGSSDMHAVERSFAHLSLRAKQPSVQRTPQPKRVTPEIGSVIGEMSPLMVVQQCLGTLVFLTQCNKSIAEFFLREHETATGFKPKSSRKGKAKDSKANKYPLNALLGLLDRKLVIESAPVMEQLASLLATITYPLTSFQKKEKKPDTTEDKDGSGTNAAEAPANVQPVGEVADVEMTSAPEVTSAPEQAPADQANPETGETTTASNANQTADESKKEEKADDKVKKPRLLESPPEVPEYNLRLVVNIVAARECNAKTFKDTLSLITHLSAIPEAKDIFGEELIRQAQDLGRSILHDLELLVTQISNAETGTDVQAMALARFSPASSDQAKLLRVMTALDWLFDPKPQGLTAAKSTDGLETQQKAEILTSLYQNETFVALWKKLSECLTAIRERGNMFNVATILLPLIEVLMVVCKNTTLKDAPLVKTLQAEFTVSSPAPEDPGTRMEDLFFNFTEEHRKILNDLVRHNPKLMSGSFSLLVKNSKVLEFDNKRNYFHRKLHSRGTEVRQPHPSLQLGVRRDQVFLDSFKSLYYKKADEFKYGKLNIRFHGEEGVDAGGVTREWFQVLAKQMFDPNYALFNPVASDRTTFHPNPLSAINPEHLTFFKFIGRIIGKALYESRVLDCHFSRAVYKRMLSKPVSIKDMETLDLDYYKSLVWMLENDITDIITETFSVETEEFGETKIVDLIPNGRNVQVTEENKHEYVRLVVEHKMIGSVKEQLENFLLGFHDIVPAELISIFNEQELELLISGLPEIDVDDWKNNTDYHNYQAASPQIQWYWRAVRSFDKEERAKLLQFITGTSKVPLNGFKELEGMNGFTRFNIHRDYGSKDRLPSSHTCFNQLDLPEYESYEQLRKALYTAMTAGSEYFGFA